MAAYVSLYNFTIKDPHDLKHAFAIAGNSAPP
jgi:hypothetical protein